MSRPVFLVAGVLLFAATLVGSAQQPLATDRVKLTIKVVEKDGEKTKVLADPTLQFAKDGTFDFFSGGEVNVSENETISFGTRVKGSVSTLEDGNYKLSAKIELSTTVGTDEPATQIVRSDSLEIRTIMIPGEPKILNCGGIRTVELSLSDR